MFWVFLIVIVSFGYLLQFTLMYIRRFYPKSWQESMEKEEACTLEYQRKPEMKFIRKLVFIGFISTILISYILSYHLFSNIEYPFKIFLKIFLTGAVIIMIFTLYYESKIKKDGNCNDTIAGYKSLKILGIISIILMGGISVFLSYFSDIQTNKYKNISEVKKDKAMHRGWIPTIVPKSAYNIKETHDLDTNTVFGRFKYKEEDEVHFIEKLTELDDDNETLIWNHFLFRIDREINCVRFKNTKTWDKK